MVKKTKEVEEDFDYYDNSDVEESYEDYSDPNIKENKHGTTYDDTFDDYRTSNPDNAELAKLLMETDTYIHRIELTLKNQFLKKLRTVRDDGKEEFSNIPTSYKNTVPLANDYGISQLIGKVKSLIHHALSQANIKDYDYNEIIGDFINEVTRAVIVHRKTWGILEENMRDVRKLVTRGPTLFITRAIQDRERILVYNRALSNFQDDRQESSDFLTSLSNKFKKKGRV